MKSYSMKEVQRTLEKSALILAEFKKNYPEEYEHGRKEKIKHKRRENTGPSLPASQDSGFAEKADSGSVSSGHESCCDGVMAVLVTVRASTGGGTMAPGDIPATPLEPPGNNEG